MKSHLGFSFIELLVAGFLGSLLLLGVIKLYYGFRNNGRWQSAIAAMQERSRFGFYLLSHRIHQAGDASCESGGRVNQHDAVIGYEAQHLPGDLRNEAIDDSDVIVLGECIHYHSQWQFIKIAYFIGDTHRKDAQGKPIFSLYEKPLQGAREELISDVRKLMIVYGVTVPDHPSIERYVRAEEVKKWEAIRSVNLTLWLHADLGPDRKLPIYVTLRER